MKKIWPAILSIALVLTGCGSDDHKPKKKYKPYKKYHAHKGTLENNTPDDIKFTYRIRPSESMSLGVDGAAKFNTIRAQNQLPEKYDAPTDDIKQIMSNGQYVGQYKVGAPYKIEEDTYYPQEYDDYEEVGRASWYGDEFHGKKTANGEIYNSGAMTAAHQTLPLPSMVRVTNLDNGKKAIVRVNDRGPFAKSRVIDVSEKAAEALGFHDKGTATVKVEFLSKETDELLATLNIKN